MNPHRKNPARDVARCQAEVSAERVILCDGVEGTEFTLPRKTLQITIGLRDDGNKDETPQLALQAPVYVVRFEKSIMGILIEVDGNIFFEGRLQFRLQRINKSGDPLVALVVLLAVADEYVVLVPGEERGHYQI